MAVSVPEDRAALEELPGVGRKTANVVLNVAFGEPTIAVDTHIFRVSNRTGLAPGKNVLDVELSLEKRVPEKYRLHAHHWLILHGRYTCVARKPLCPTCVVRDLCHFPDKTKELPAEKPERRNLRPLHAQSVEAGGIGFVARSARHSLHMLDFGRRTGEEKECPARGGVVTPHFRRAILASESGRARQGAQLRGLEPREGIRLARGRRGRDGHRRRRGRALGRGAAGERQNKQGRDAFSHSFPGSRWASIGWLML